MRRVTPLLLALPFVGCSEPQRANALHDQRKATLDHIADKCGLARTTFKLIGDDDLHVRPSQDAPYESVDCALRELKIAKMPVKTGYVGNEYYSNEMQ